MASSEDRARFAAEDIAHDFSGVLALRDVSFDLEAGVVHALVGENGSGKSTLIKVMTGALQPVAGRLLLDGHELRFSTPAHAQRNGIGVVHQDYHLFPDLSVAANVFGVSKAPPRRRLTRAVDKAEVERQVEKLFAELDIDVPGIAFVRELGPAERKFVEIARAMLLQPRFLILDEPTASLEPQASQRVLDLLGRLRAQGVGLAFVSHRLDEVLQIADRVTVLRDGRRVAHQPAAGLDEDGLAKLIVGDGHKHRERVRRTTGTDVMLRVSGCCARRGADPVSFEVRRGEIFGLTGLLGSGAAEVVRQVAGVERPDGTIEVAGREVRLRHPADALRAGIGFIPEDRKAVGLVPEQSVAMNVSLASLKEVTNRGWLTPGAVNKRAEHYRRDLDIRTRSVKVPVKTLSGGNQQKVMLAKWLASGVSVLAIEEPTHGIDIGGKAQVHELLRRFADAGGCIVVASTDVHEVIDLCDRIGVMRHGSLTRVLDPYGLDGASLTALGARDAADLLESLVETGHTKGATA